MPIVRTFGRVERKDPLLSSIAKMIANDLSKDYADCAVEILCSGSADDYADWITIGIQTTNERRIEHCAEAFAKRLTRFGAVLLSPR